MGNLFFAFWQARLGCMYMNAAVRGGTSTCHFDYRGDRLPGQRASPMVLFFRIPGGRANLLNIFGKRTKNRWATPLPAGHSPSTVCSGGAMWACQTDVVIFMSILH